MIRPSFLLQLGDTFLAGVCLILAHYLRYGRLSSETLILEGGIFKLASYVVVVIIISYLFNLYEFQQFNELWRVAAKIVFALTVSLLALSALFYILPGLGFWRGVLLISLLLFGFCQILVRWLIRKFSRVSFFANRVLIVGAGSLAKKISEIVPSDHNMHSYTRFVACTDKVPVVDPDLIVGHINDIDQITLDYRPQKMVIALAERRGNLPLKEIMHSKLRGVEVYDAATYYEHVSGCLMIEEMHPSSFIFNQRFRMTPFMRSYKRLFDVALSGIGLLITAPFFPFIALAIVLDSRGPVFYKQLRVGENEHEFFVYKFRTMSDGAENDSGAVWAQKNDPRVTRVGHFMRKTRIDEIPQLYNVFKGDMSFIGPRPERMTFVERLKESIPFYSTRHFVKPGVTGWAQVRYPYGASDEDALEKLRYDLYYIKNYSIALDFKIILDTIRVVTSGFGGR
ncbi:MAG: TIGR03013 family PEP-CTERM/XrtA system glycosyltransferase [Desulfuromonadales bacterium]|nr:TIGR03013 family PEP-CTERM/XrtA system glycosyltransferase [Desulfuromonadales bacterium]